MCEHSGFLYTVWADCRCYLIFSIFALNEVQTRYLVGSDFGLAFFLRFTLKYKWYKLIFDRIIFWSSLFFSIIVLKYNLMFDRIRVWFHFSSAIGSFVVYMSASYWLLYLGSRHFFLS